MYPRLHIGSLEIGSYLLCGVAALTVALTVPLIPVFMVLIATVMLRERLRPLEWGALAAAFIGAVLVPIYSTLTAEEIEFIVGHSESKVVIVENNEQLEKALSARKKCPRLEKIVVIESEDVKLMPQGVMSFADMMQAGSRKHAEDPTLFEKMAEDVGVEDLASIVYTSGTTGHPKGAMISHKNIMAQIKALASVEPQYGFDTDQTVPFLPLSHVFERIAGHFFGMYVGLTSSYAESMDTIVADIQEKRPTEILAAWEAGADLVKVFPADALGPRYLKAIAMRVDKLRAVTAAQVQAAAREWLQDARLSVAALDPQPLENAPRRAAVPGVRHVN